MEQKEGGNEAYRTGNFDEAVGYYDDAFFYLPLAAEEGLVDQSQESSLELTLWLNLAQALLSLVKASPVYKPYSISRALEACDSALDIDPNNVKALFHRQRIVEFMTKNEKG